MKEVGLMVGMWVVLAATSLIWADTGHLKAGRVAEGNSIRTSSVSVTTDPYVLVVSSADNRPSLICFNNGANAVALGSPGVSSTTVVRTGIVLVASATVNMGSFLGQVNAVTLTGTTEVRCWEGLTQ